MLEFTFDNGYTLYLDNLFTFICFFTAMGYLCWTLNSKQFDKALHFTISAAMTFALLTLFHYTHWAWWIAPMIVLLIGVLKETYDRIFKAKHLFDLWDLLADTIGVAGVTLPFIFSFLFYK